MLALALALALAAAPPTPLPPAAFTGDFAAVPADQALRTILDPAGLSVVLPPGPLPTVTAHFQGAGVDDAVAAICAEAGLTATRHGTVVIVAAKGSQPPAPPAPPAPNPPDGADAPVPGHPWIHAGKNDRVAVGDVMVKAGERVRDVVALRGDATLGPGAYAREVTAILGSVHLEPGAVVDREVAALGGSVHVDPGARVGGEATAVGGRVQAAQGGSVQGKITHVPWSSLHVNLSADDAPRSTSALMWLGTRVVEFGVWFALGLMVLWAWPNRMERVAQAMRQTPVRSTAVGLLGAVAIPLLSILLAITVVGLVALPVVALGVAMAAVLGMPALSVAIGRRLPGRQLTPVGQLAVGTAIVVLATQLPGVGGPLFAVAMLVGLGAVLATRFGGQAGSGVS